MVALCFAANAPDLDFLPGVLVGDPARFHHGPTHTVFAVVVFGALSGVVAKWTGLASWRRAAVLMGLAYASHLVLDLITRETGEPGGMTILWPFSAHPFSLPFHVFLEVKHSEPAQGFLTSLWQWHNVRAVAWELVVAGGLWALYRGASAISSPRTEM